MEFLNVSKKIVSGSGPPDILTWVSRKIQLQSSCFSEILTIWGQLIHFDMIISISWTERISHLLVLAMSLGVTYHHFIPILPQCLTFSKLTPWLCLHCLGQIHSATSKPKFKKNPCALSVRYFIQAIQKIKEEKWNQECCLYWFLH